MPIVLHFADLPTPDMAWLCTPDRLILIVDRRVPRDLIVDTINLGLSWLADGAQGEPPRRPIAA